MKRASTSHVAWLIGGREWIEEVQEDPGREDRCRVHDKVATGAAQAGFWAAGPRCRLLKIGLGSWDGYK